MCGFLWFIASINYPQIISAPGWVTAASYFPKAANIRPGQLAGGDNEDG
uniref:Uncharacterized protein n=1 Tax=Yersinia enterocolitica W22703 TaxID=913028 RepID=F4N5M3_YEREN|nr:unknown protein [Yersinia enterocolitica W22703]